VIIFPDVTVYEDKYVYHPSRQFCDFAVPVFEPLKRKGVKSMSVPGKETTEQTVLYIVRH
jgi:hypothetical protein